jgi:NAD(P)H-dependent FMN reductase
VSAHPAGLFVIKARTDKFNMKTIAIISTSVRSGRKSHRVALYFSNYLEENKIAKADIIDLKDYNFPLFDERLRLQKEPSPGALEFADRIRRADGVIIVAPEYNGGYPASLKNVVDLLYDEWRRKPVAISTVSDGPFGGTQVITSIQFTLWKMGAWTVPAMFPVPRVSETFNEQGRPSDRSSMDKRAARLINELLWCIDATGLMAARTSS